MYYIRPCPSCGQKVRFPIDKGKVKVTCSCNHSFVVDPDDPSLFREGVFDLAGGLKKKVSKPSILSMVKSFNPTEIKSWLITALYDYRYHLQNIRLLTNEEKKRVVMQGLLFIIVILFIIYMIVYFSVATPSISEDVI